MYIDTDPQKAVFVERFKEITGKDKVDTIAERLHIDPNTVKKWRSPANNTLPSLQNLLQICDEYYPCTIDYLFGYDESYSLQYEKITELTGLSSPAIDTLQQESSEDGRIGRIKMLNYILSDRKVFSDLMDNLISLYYPSMITMDWKEFQKVCYDPENDCAVIKPSHINALSKDTPDRIHRNIQNILDEFGNTLKEKEPIT